MYVCERVCICMERNWKSLYCMYIYIYILSYIYIDTIPRILSPVPTQKEENRKCVVLCRVVGIIKREREQRTTGGKVLTAGKRREESTGYIRYSLRCHDNNMLSSLTTVMIYCMDWQIAGSQGLGHWAVQK